MAWQKVSAQMVEVLDCALATFPCQRKMMFGCPAYFVNGNMFAGVHQSSILLRLSATDRQEMFATFDETELFEPMPGRPMKEYVVLSEAVHGDLSILRDWLSRSLDYASSLPPKESKSRKPKK